MVGTTTPGPEWYEPPDLPHAVSDDDEAPHSYAELDELLIVAGGIVHWTAATPDDDE